jgi:hypothetical protein
VGRQRSQCPFGVDEFFLTSTLLCHALAQPAPQTWTFITLPPPDRIISKLSAAADDDDDSNNNNNNNESRRHDAEDPFWQALHGRLVQRRLLPPLEPSRTPSARGDRVAEIVRMRWFDRATTPGPADAALSDAAAHVRDALRRGVCAALDAHAAGARPCNVPWALQVARGLPDDDDAMSTRGLVSASTVRLGHGGWTCVDRTDPSASSCLAALGKRGRE